MKRIVEEVAGDGLEKLLGQTVQLWCMNYIYSGKLVGVTDADVCLADGVVVYETGELDSGGWKNAQSMGVEELFVRTASIEAYCVVP